MLIKMLVRVFKPFPFSCLVLSKVETQAVVQTFASPTFSSFLDMLLCCSVFLALSLACFLRPLVTHQSLSTPALTLTAVATLLEALALLFAVR